MNNFSFSLSYIRIYVACFFGLATSLLCTQSYGQNNHSEWLIRNYNIDETQYFIRTTFPKKVKKELLNKVSTLEKAVKKPSANPWFAPSLRSFLTQKTTVHSRTKKIEMLVFFIPEPNSPEIAMGSQTSVTRLDKKSSLIEDSSENKLIIKEEKEVIKKIHYLKGMEGNFYIRFDIYDRKKTEIIIKTHTFLIGSGHRVSFSEYPIHKG